MGYAGGSKVNPTYHDLGDHTETIEIEFDPSVISYADLLEIFWRSHDPRRPAWSRQYMSAIFTHDEEQKRLAEESRDREASRGGGAIATEIVGASTFYPAEGYHQKYYLRLKPQLYTALRRFYASEDAFVDSTAAARLNAYLAGYGSLRDVEAEIERLAPSPSESKEILKALRFPIR